MYCEGENTVLISQFCSLKISFPLRCSYCGCYQFLSFNILFHFLTEMTAKISYSSIQVFYTYKHVITFTFCACKLTDGYKK